MEEIETILMSKQIEKHTLFKEFMGNNTSGWQQDTRVKGQEGVRTRVEQGGRVQLHEGGRVRSH